MRQEGNALKIVKILFHRLEKEFNEKFHSSFPSEAGVTENVFDMPSRE